MPDTANPPPANPAPAPPPVILKLSVGDHVIYPNQGLCTVTEIKTDEIAGQKMVFVTLVFVETGAKVKVPQEKLVKNGVRRVSTPDDVKKVFDFLKSDSERASLDWKKRARDNTARLSEGGLKGLAEVVKGLQVLSELRPLPPKEREQYNDARHLFVSELSAAMHIGEADAEDSLDILLSPVGKERPKRSIEEFKALVGEGGDDLLGDDLLGLDGETAEPGEEPIEGAEPAEAAEGEEQPAAPVADAPKKRGRPPKAKPGVAVAAPPKKPVISDLEVTEPAATALPPDAPRKRGRPPKPKPTVLEVAAPKKRGRPPKPKPAHEPEPKKRGRPPKKK